MLFHSGDKPPCRRELDDAHQAAAENLSEIRDELLLADRYTGKGDDKLQPPAASRARILMNR